MWDLSLKTLNIEYWFSKAYVRNGSKHSQQQFYQNVINAPLLHGVRDRKVLGLLNIPELHLLIGKWKFC